jgi:hypothetical protein
MTMNALKRERAAVRAYYVALDDATQASNGADYWNSKEGCDIEGWSEELAALSAVENAKREHEKENLTALASIIGLTVEITQDCIDYAMEELGVSVDWLPEGRPFLDLCVTTLDVLRTERRCTA